MRHSVFSALKICFADNPSVVLSQLIRTSFIAPEGCRFIIADFSAIEARVIAWLADEKWRMDVFAQGGDIYCASASAIFNVPVEKHGVNHHLRSKGKIAELACGFGGGVNALKAFGADKMGFLILIWILSSRNGALPALIFVNFGAMLKPPLLKPLNLNRQPLVKKVSPFKRLTIFCLSIFPPAESLPTSNLVSSKKTTKILWLMTVIFTLPAVGG